MPSNLPQRDSEGKLPAYAWPGGYAVAYVCNDGEYLCATCVNDPKNPTHEGGDADGWRLDGYITADWHDTGEGDWVCVNCGRVIDCTHARA